MARILGLFILAGLLAAGCSTPSGTGTPNGGYKLPSGDVTQGEPGTDIQKGIPDGSAAPDGDGSAALSDADTTTAGDAGTDGPEKATYDASGPSANVDSDGDGYTPAQGDCDDTDPKIHPGAAEFCNGKDDDCNGFTDDVDNDKDGYSVCPGPKQDCDDSNPAIHPGAKPYCANGKDNDCDGTIDANQDADGDGYNVCDDCDDKDPNVHPGAPVNCKNGKDNNCDGVKDNAMDADQDGSPACEDCNDADAAIHPGAVEICDGKDNDCNGQTDDMDNDGDGWSGCGQDCDDNDITIYPGAMRNCKNGKDNDCDGIIDAVEDGDGDGYAGCADCNDYNKFINPGAMEYPADSIDNNCNGLTDEVPAPCDTPGLSSNADASYAPAIDLCIGVQSSNFPTLASPLARAVKQKYGPQNTPISGPNFAVLSSGIAAAEGDANYISPQGGKDFGTTANNPSDKCMSSGAAHDYTEWKLVLKVPTNVQAFSFDFNFMSAEYPEWVGSAFNDKFMAVLDSKNFKGNISFDSKGSCISINNALFNVCQGCKLGDGDLAGTGYEGGIGGGTGWLTTTSPVTPGETITLKFMIFDESDGILDSVVLIDDVRWHLKAAGSAPSTVRPGG